MPSVEAQVQTVRLDPTAKALFGIATAVIVGLLSWAGVSLLAVKEDVAVMKTTIANNANANNEANRRLEEVANEVKRVRESQIKGESKIESIEEKLDDLEEMRGSLDDRMDALETMLTSIPRFDDDTRNEIRANSRGLRQVQTTLEDTIQRLNALSREDRNR